MRESLYSISIDWSRELLKDMIAHLLLLVWMISLPAALQADDEVSIVPRDEWGARPPRDDISTWSEYGLERPDYTRIVLHVTSMGRGYGKAEAKRIQDFHMDQRGFSDIGYNFLVDSDGEVFEGRLLDYVPAHAGRTIEGDEQHDIRLDPDYGSIGIVFSADTDQALTTDQVDAGITLVSWLEKRYPVSSVITHTEVRQSIEARALTPRRDFDPETCPGSGSVDQIIQIREAVDASFDADVYRDLFSES